VRERTWLAALGCAAMILASASAAHAAEESSGKSSANLEEARQHAAKAKVHYDLGEYEKAAEEYIIVYRLRPLPALLFNIAQSYRQAGQYEKARQFYKSYLRETDDPKNRAQIEKAIREMDELLAKEKRAKAIPPTGVAQTPGVSGGSVAGAAAATAAGGAAGAPGGSVAGAASPQAAGAPAGAVPAGTAQAGGQQAASAKPVPAAALTATAVDTSRGRSKTYAYVSAGTAAVLIVSGLYVASTASKFEDELNARPHSAATIDDLSSTAKSRKTTGALLLGAGLAAAGAASYFYFFTPTGDGVAVQGRF